MGGMSTKHQQKTAFRSAKNKKRLLSISLTPQERQAILLVLALFILGLCVRWFRG